MTKDSSKRPVVRGITPVKSRGAAGNSLNVTPQERAEELMEWISAASAELRSAQAEYQEELEGLKAKHQPIINEYNEVLKGMEKELFTLAKKNRKEIFDGADSVHLETGSLFYTCRLMVRKAKTVNVELLKGLEWHDGIRIEESVDWDVIQDWPDERLAAIGTERKKKEDISYELKE